MRDVNCILQTQALLGECPRWHARERALYWVDIGRHEMARFDPATEALQVRRFEDPVACFAFRSSGGFLLGMRTGFALLESLDSDPQPIEPQMLAELPDNRLNDGRCDGRGRFWAGSMNTTKARADGALFRVDRDHSIHRCLDGALTSNGIAFSPDGSLLYYADTPKHVVHTYPLRNAGNTLGPGREFRRFPVGHGRPDGASVDAEGCYWSALYDGGRVVRLSPQGELLEEVSLPVRHCTMVAFGGDDWRTAYVTTARQGMSEEELERLPQSGGLFSFQVETPGLPEVDFEG